MSSIGERIEVVRNKSGLSQEAFAETLGISRNSYFKYIRGHRAIPSDVFSAILEKYGTHPAWLHEGDEGLTNRTTSLLDEMKHILQAVDNRAEERGLSIEFDKRWLIACRICVERVMAAKQSEDVPEVAVSEIDNWLEVAQ
ncbi:helix-turn-helix domain-containing protein [Ruegeria sp. Ofav3-42]|uniref:helix-turn-helix domain-containing protein n=1 Tax=Ruegeria sp. Ofav3-42 TaxID=2917759 RepID=UPI001EF665E5|nr:helix-turn-helix transcriptional regulator [Ruegeria sp. Ofav3-42]MCG7518965.1 helix-turn-helix domain-containing protein [Ruegeria sp. Ofav3-42]